VDFGALPPEVNSGRMYNGAGAESLLAAAAGWERLAGELHSTAAGYQSLIAGLTDDSWTGPSSMSMGSVAAAQLSWIRETAGRCEDAATRAIAAAAVYETAFATMVPPSAVADNRASLARLSANNPLGHKTPAIAAAEAEYSEMWAKDAAAMYDYAASSAVASSFSNFTPPPWMAAQGGTGAAGAHDASARLISLLSRALQGLSAPGMFPALLGFAGDGGPDLAGAFSLDGLSALADPWAGADGGAAAGFGQADAVGSMSVPPSWADTLAMDPPDFGDSSMQLPSLRVGIPPAGIAKPPDGSVARIGYRGTPLVCSSVAG
jgi:PPE family/PPE-SVP subfamily C-terminal region